jgi:hypothetical protein
MATSMRTAIDEARSSAVPAGTGWPRFGVIWSIGRIEASQMLRHPVFLLSVAFALLLFRGAIGASSETGLVLNLAWLVGGLAVGTLIGCVLTANVATVQARRDRLVELYGSLPAPTEARTAGLLLGLALGIGGFSVVVGAVAWYAFERLDEDLAAGADAFLYGQYLLAVVGLGTFGVAVGRWIPTVLGGPLVVVAHVFSGVMWIVPWIAITSSGVGVPWHLAYLVAVIVGFAALAFTRDRRTVPRVVLAIAALGVAVVAAVQQAPPGGY